MWNEERRRRKLRERRINLSSRKVTFEKILIFLCFEQEEEEEKNSWVIVGSNFINIEWVYLQSRYLSFVRSKILLFNGLFPNYIIKSKGFSILFFSTSIIKGHLIHLTYLLGLKIQSLLTKMRIIIQSNSVVRTLSVFPRYNCNIVITVMVCIAVWDQKYQWNLFVIVVNSL